VPIAALEVPMSDEQHAIGNLIFVSYRRADTAAQSLALRLELETHFRAAQVFLDTHTIQGGEVWPTQIQDALRVAKVVIAVIGRQWTGMLEGGARRIDDADDWVHKEISYALDRKPGAIVPILIDGTPPLRRTDLPEAIKGLADIQNLNVNLNEWDKDIQQLFDNLESRFHFEIKQTKYRFPKPDPLIAKTIPMPWKDLESEAARALPEWRIEFSDDPDKLNYKRVELVRDFQFKSFEQAMEFMMTVSKYATEADHHPRWMNLWRTVTVWLSTWDAGHRITVLDTQFARFLNRKYKEYKV
jgi:pterin-4a-carbinolamine dehydratase